ncbi:MAG: hypothetical protein QOJ22_857 [Thermoleophilaceae bacterium]|jgi:uncharacterized cupredoxin-like copper-binding protein|nr:hypothetical protein [Thermoleophilaceae bacterium]
MRTPLVTALAGLLLLAGCGGSGDGKGGGGKGKTVTVAADQTIEVSADEYKFGPSNIVVNATGDAPAEVRLSLTNDGGLAHDLHVTKGGEDLGGTPIFGPGMTKDGSARLGPGKYEFICTVGNHADLGMKGTLTVVAPK